ncbi:MAG: Ig-like domain-containing protein [Candidatus Shapirobacteria bacterium]|nr:Ig-like domain-containing protein [Candidatus Shapirobacteria bacterium]
MKPEKHIPTILGLLLLIAAVFGGVILTSKNFNFNPQASGGCEPINPQITNVTYESAVISFSTNAECLTNININNQITKNDKSSKIHYFEINSLKENSDYSFSIISGGNNFNSSSFQINTAKKPVNQSISSDLAWGKILNPDGNPASNVLVYLNIPGASPLSAITTSSGNWNITLSTSFNDSKTNWFTPPQGLEEDIFIISSNQITTQIINNTSLNNPVPDIIIGQDNLTSPQVETKANGVLPSAEINIDNSIDKKLDILNPTDNESLSTKKPEFFGTAPSKSKITIEVHSSEILNGETISDENGEWNWSVPKNLTPGEHTITVTTKNEAGVLETITRKFIVLAAENDTNFTASSSAVTNTPTPTPKIIITPTPTATPTPIITKVENPSTSSGIPKTGATFPTFIIIFSSLCLLTVSLFFYHKN